MLKFSPIELSDIDLFTKYLDINKYQNSLYNFTTLYAWREDFDFKYALINDCLCITAKNNMCFFPLGERKNVLTAIKSLKEYYGGQIKFGVVSEDMVSFFSDNAVFEKFEVTPERDYYDYIYKREKLVSLGGKKLHGKRNHFNYFIQNYKYEFTDITDETACDEKLKQIIYARNSEPLQEYKATASALKNREAFGLIGKCLIADGQIAGVILAQNHYGTALIQIAKSDTNFRGASVALFQFFLKDYLTECENVNFMEDMGSEGLRSAKLSYNPEGFIEKYTIKGLPS